MTMTASITPEPTPRDGLHGPETASTVESGQREGQDAPDAADGHTAGPAPSRCPVSTSGTCLHVEDDGPQCRGACPFTAAPAPADRRQQYAEAIALRHNGPASDGRGWFRNEDERQRFLTDADAVLAVRDAEVDDLCQRLARQAAAAHDMTARLGEVEAALDEARAELARRDASESADAAAGSYAGRAEQAEAALERVTGARLCDDCRVNIRAAVATPGRPDA